jgi:predicted transcriptional regulator
VTTIHVTEAESVILEALWRCGPLTPPRLMTEVGALRPWGEPTIKTLLGRLMRKKAVRSVREEGLLRYHPMIERSAYIEREAKALIDRWFNGDRTAFLTFLAEPAL